MHRPFLLALAALSSLGLGAQAQAQSASSPTSAPSDEQQVTRSLNSEISQRLIEADRHDAAETETYRAAVERYQADLARYEAARELRAESLVARRDGIDHEQQLYNRRMDDWRATVAACEAGDRVRCESGKAPPQPRPYP